MALELEHLRIYLIKMSEEAQEKIASVLLIPMADSQLGHTWGVLENLDA